MEKIYKQIKGTPGESFFFFFFGILFCLQAWGIIWKYQLARAREKRFRVQLRQLLLQVEERVM